MIHPQTALTHRAPQRNGERHYTPYIKRVLSTRSALMCLVRAHPSRFRRLPPSPPQFEIHRVSWARSGSCAFIARLRTLVGYLLLVALALPRFLGAFLCRPLTVSAVCARSTRGTDGPIQEACLPVAEPPIIRTACSAVPLVFQAQRAV